jgi:hypothetical protein
MTTGVDDTRATGAADGPPGVDTPIIVFLKICDLPLTDRPALLGWIGRSVRPASQRCSKRQPQPCMRRPEIAVNTPRAMNAPPLRNRPARAVAGLPTTHSRALLASSA